MASVDEFTHILDIKIIHLVRGDIIKNKDLLKIVKRCLIDYLYTYTITLNDKSKEVKLSWKKKKWEYPYNKFIGDLVLNAPYNIDAIIQEDTSKTIKRIVQELRLTQSYWNDFNIIFHISKPLCLTSLN